MSAIVIEHPYIIMGEYYQNAARRARGGQEEGGRPIVLSICVEKNMSPDGY
jgi:hypothetical protein